jgi:hypothetical protein
MNITDDNGSGACLMNTGEISLHSRLAWASDSVFPSSSPVIASWCDAGWSSCSKRLAWANDSVRSCRSQMIVSWWDPGRRSCGNGLAGASSGDAGWLAKLLLAWWALAITGGINCRCLLLVDSQLQCSLNVSIAVTDASMSEVCVFINLLLGGKLTNGRWELLWWALIR